MRKTKPQIQNSKNMKTLQQHIDEVMDYFDFDKVHRVMESLNWRWSSLEDEMRIPTKPEMRKHVREFMEKLYEKNINKSEVNTYTGSGGFMVYYRKNVDEKGAWDHFDVTFQLESWYTGE